jgi:cytochrome c biogenesis protein CcdA
MRFRFLLCIVLPIAALALVLIACTARPTQTATPAALVSGPVTGDSIVRVAYFYRDDCAHCMVVISDVLKPLQTQYGERLQIKAIQFHDPNREGGVDPARYGMLIAAEEMFGVSAERRGIPTLVIDGQVLIGEEEIRAQLPCLLGSCVAAGGVAWPEIPGLDAIPAGLPDVSAVAITATFTPDAGQVFQPSLPGGAVTTCVTTTVCPSGPPVVWAAYFYQVGCQECSRAESDIRYVQSQHAQVQIQEFNIYDDAGLAQCLARRVGRDDVHAPAVFIGDDALIGEAEIAPQSLEMLVQKYASAGTGQVWEQCANENGVTLPSTLTVIVAGLLDGLNPCAFATLIFFVSYLAASERKGREILAVGAAFALGVFLTYLAIGLGLYKLVDAVRDTHAIVGRVVYVAIALFCGVLAVLSFLDFVKARRGQLEDMALVMPEGLRRRVHAVIRRTSSTRAFVAVALVTGAAVSFLELACTGQVYLATIISMVNTQGAQAQAIPLLALYNLMFIVPLVVVFVLVYFGATSHQLGFFLHRHTATVKLGTAVLFLVLAGWLVFSVLRG